MNRHALATGIAPESQVIGAAQPLIGGHRQVLTETFDADAALDMMEREGAPYSTASRPT